MQQERRQAVVMETYPLRLPLSARDKVAFAPAGLKVQRAVRRYARRLAPQPGDTPAAVRARVLGFEDHRTFAELLGPLPPAVADIFACAAHRAMAELGELSAGCGVGLFALVWGGKGSLIARNLLGGTGRLPEALGNALGARAVTGTRVTALVPEGDGDGDGVVVQAEGRRVRTRHVVLATQAPHAAPLARPLAPATADALERLSDGAFLSVAVPTTETTAMVWDGIHAMPTPGRVFDMFTNQAHVLRGPGPRRPGGSLMLFAGAHRAQALIAASDAVITERFLTDLHALFPATRGIVADATVQRWPLGNVFARPGRSALQAPLEGALGPRANLHVAGDDFAELGSMEAAARTGLAAARHVRAALDGDREGARAAA